ncbi:MAG: hypothetical protein DHS20C18_07790 [Saprospiraceae bacterium]|nr:MAG: hypothetical protein DHS20C18_07790 [Saprospiraceae bacterium]
MVIFRIQIGLLVLCTLGLTGLTAQPLMSDYFKIEKVKIPDGIELEVGGLAFDDQGNLGVATRRGEVWLIKNYQTDKPTYTRFAHGLHEPLGLNFKDGAFFCAQRGELTKLTDKNNDGRADSYEALYTWDLAGNYHEYSYGPVFTPEGDMLVTLNLGWIGRGASLSEWRGWLVKITKEGKLIPMATGLRSPAGFGYNKDGDIFYTENQGDWVGSGRMTHLEIGDFAGNPEGLKWTSREGSPLKLKPEDIDDTKGLTLYQYAQELEAIKPPSVWFPHTLMGISTSGFVNLKDEFGPAFNGQMLVGDQGHSKIMRVSQEKINGVYQGACFPFVDGFSSGVLRLEWSPMGDGLYVGMTSRGWASTGAEDFALERLVWSGKTPFDIKSIRAHAEGFTIEFTQPADKASLADPTVYQITDFTYKYHHFYGSPVTDKQSRTIQKVTVAEDGRSVVLHLDRLRKGYINEVKAIGVRSASGQMPVFGYGYYTLNEIPGGGKTIAETTEPTSETTSGAITSKNLTEMPTSWTNGPDQEIVMATKPGMKYDMDFFSITAGQKIKLTLNNNDDMLHNLVITLPGKATEVGEAALKLGLDGESMQYIPNSESVLFHTKLLQPESSESIYFVAPKEPGAYEFVCTFPGHHMTMRGKMQVYKGDMF